MHPAFARRLATASLAMILVTSSTVQHAATAGGPKQAQGAPQTAADVADAARRLPPGWTLVRLPTGQLSLRLALDEPLAIRNARPDFTLGDVVIGHPVESATDRRTLALGLERLPAGDLSTLRAFHGATPLDPISRSAPRGSETDGVPGLGDGQARPPLNAFDPARPGGYSVARRQYSLTPFADPDMKVPLEVVGEVTTPVGAPGRRPLVLILHGRHGTCYIPGDADYQGLEWPCPSGQNSIPSYKGYRYLADLLASQGFLVVSISANAINAQDGEVIDAGMAARSRLVRHHLDLWNEWATVGGDPIGGVLRGHVAMDEVVLIGHSRGGEGVERAVIDARAAGAPYRITGLALIGPTAFGRQTAVGVHTAVILPYCDGDVSDLQGQTYVDNALKLTALQSTGALHSAVMVKGANHNFFNSQWTPGQAAAPSIDDWSFAGSADNKRCGPNRPDRLTAVEQQRAGATYMAALVRLATMAEQRAVPFLDGSWTRARSSGRAVVVTHAVGGRRVPIITGAAAKNVTTSGSMHARICDGSTGVFAAPSRCSQSERNTPHWLPSAVGAVGLRALKLTWPRKSAAATIALAKPVDLTDLVDVDVRAALDPNSLPVDLRIRLTGENGKSVTLKPVTPQLYSLLGRGGPIPKIWAQTIRGTLSGVPADIRRSVAKISLVAQGAKGVVYVLDVWGRRGGASAPAPVSVPVIDIPDVIEPEGSAPHTYKWVLPITGTVAKPAKLLVTVVNPDFTNTTKVVTVAPGSTSITVPIKVPGDTVFAPFQIQTILAVEAIENIATAKYAGTFTPKEDDPAPTVTIDQNIVTPEGKTVTFTVTLSEPVAFPVYVSGMIVAGKKPELTVGDLTPAQQVQFGADPAKPGVKLSALNAFLGTFLEPGVTTARFTFDTRKDGVTEGNEYMSVEFGNQPWNPLFADPRPCLVTVTANST